MDEQQVLLSNDGKMEALNTYILAIPSNDGVDIYSCSNLYYDYIVAMAMWDRFSKLIAEKSDQDIYTFCKEEDLDYDLIIEIARDARNNG